MAALKVSYNVKGQQDKLPTMYWLPMLHIYIQEINKVIIKIIAFVINILDETNPYLLDVALTYIYIL